jgi:membrane protease YdiL (CAAX protease family)
METSSQFTHLLFWNNKIAFLCFFSFAMSFISLWIKKTAWLWATFLGIAIILAWESHVISYMALIPISVLFFCQYCLTREIAKPIRLILFGIVVIVSLALGFHFLPGFNNWKLVSQAQLCPNALPYSLFLNFDKPFMGIFTLALSVPLLSTAAQWRKMLKITLPSTLLGILVMAGIALKIGMIAWCPKITWIFFPWMIINLIFVSIPEEAFFRGFIQRELYLWFGKTPLSAIGSVVITSFFFVLLHLIWVGSYSFLSLVFIASVIYGALYQWTQAIESSIFCHYLFNVTHFLLFTYPALS